MILQLSKRRYIVLEHVAGWVFQDYALAKSLKSEHQGLLMSLVFSFIL